MWAPADAKFTVTDKQVTPRLSLIAALDTDGRIWCSLTQANTDNDVMIMFLQHLVRQLDREAPGWQESTTLLLDNASWHTSAEMKERLAKLNLDIMYSAPSCYSAAPIEMMFSVLKLGDLNPGRLPTGKKALSDMADMVGNKLAGIPRSTAVRYWHHVVANLYSYLYYERI